MTPPPRNGGPIGNGDLPSMSAVPSRILRALCVIVGFC
jgi:hypothetical protein